MGDFGAASGAAAALLVASRLPRIAAVVARAGRIDLLGPEALGAVSAPTLLVAGERDPAAVEASRAALPLLQCERRLAVVPGADHLFEAPGALAAVARLAAGWFSSHLGVEAHAARP